MAPRSWTGSGQSSGRAWRNASGGSREGNLPLLVRIAVISTLDGPDWGGSEELWAAMAHEALTAGDDVFVSVNRWTDKPSQISSWKRPGPSSKPGAGLANGSCTGRRRRCSCPYRSARSNDSAPTSSA